MIVRCVKDREYIVKIPNNKLNINCYNDIIMIIKNIIKKYINVNNGNCVYKMDIYYNLMYGIIVDIKILSFLKNRFDIKLVLHVDSIFLYEIDYFDICELKIDGIIYFYKGKYYLDVSFNTCEKNYISLLEYGNVVYGEDVLNIINNGIRIYSHNFS